jgi:hypothetical protein
VLAGRSVLKIGTHCGETTGDAITAKYGRVANEQSPLREGFVYRLLDVMGVPTLKARPARITYVYTDGRSSAPDRRQSIVRHAVVIEDDDEAVSRLGGTRQIDEKGFTSARDQFAPADTALVAFAEAMLGNFDWCLKMTREDAYRCNARHPLWNVLAIVGSDNRARPLIYDFDVAGMVTGRHRWFKDVYYDGFMASRSQPAIEVLGQVQRTRSLFGRTELDATRQHFMQKKSDAYKTLDSSNVDAAGKLRIREYLDAFFAAIGTRRGFLSSGSRRRGRAGVRRRRPDQSGVQCDGSGAGRHGGERSDGDDRSDDAGGAAGHEVELGDAETVRRHP